MSCLHDRWNYTYGQAFVTSPLRSVITPSRHNRIRRVKFLIVSILLNLTTVLPSLDAGYHSVLRHLALNRLLCSNESEIV